MFKAVVEKIFTQIARYEIILLIVPYLLWIFCFRHFFTGALWLEADATSYAEHIGFFTDNLSKGIYPLWDPDWFSGAPYHFFLRRIGDFNPLLGIIVILKWLGINSATAYLFFLGFYYFLAAAGFYLVIRLLLADRFYAFLGYILFLFSSWGCEVFYNYIVIIFVPILWFFYFTLSFNRNPQKSFFLGACFCIALIITTYIPFFFFIILTVFMLFLTVFYWHVTLDFFQKIWVFLSGNKSFGVCCLLFILLASLPAIIFYKESKLGEFVMPNRHMGADVSSAVAVGLDNVSSGDIISHGYFDRIFEDQAHIDMGDIYLPYLFYIFLLVSIFAKVEKINFFLVFNILTLGAITLTSASGIHHFLYKHFIIFKFIRNIYYFFWLAILPMGIFLAVCVFRSLLNAVNISRNKTGWLLYILACHLGAGVFLFFQNGVLWGAWVALAFSFLYFLIYFYCQSRLGHILGFCLLLTSVFIQSAQVYNKLAVKLFKFQEVTLENGRKEREPVITKMSLYYTSAWFALLVEFLDPQVLEDYRGHPFVMYDNVLSYKDSSGFFKTLQEAMAQQMNAAFVSVFESKPQECRMSYYTPQKADFNPVLSKKITVVHQDANGWVLKTHLSSSQFLVVNDNFNTGWQASINGHFAHLMRANVAFKGLWLPAGESRVVLRFGDAKTYFFHIGLIVLFWGIFVYLITLLISRGF